MTTATQWLDSLSEVIFASQYTLPRMQGFAQQLHINAFDLVLQASAHFNMMTGFQRVLSSAFFLQSVKAKPLLNDQQCGRLLTF